MSFFHFKEEKTTVSNIKPDELGLVNRVSKILTRHPTNDIYFLGFFYT
jgi:hypothetical protein